MSSKVVFGRVGPYSHQSRDRSVSGKERIGEEGEPHAPSRGKGASTGVFLPDRGTIALALTISMAIIRHVSSLEKTVGRSEVVVKRNTEEVACYKRKLAEMAKSFEELKSKYDHEVKTG
ncbi:hypothetical protein Pfo_015229 [Paulownia fortunei]|nr:hypothetical protein Pfo_015229 [Paulownia fortunei]